MNSTEIGSNAVNHLKELTELVNNVDVVSFDFFDTLFVRPLCKPEDAFDILGIQLDIEDFRERRKHAQALGFQQMHAMGLKEITIEMIYDNFITDQYTTQQLVDAEYELELKLVHPNAELVDIYEMALSQGKTVVITSDMYLPRSFFVKALELHNISMVPIFASSSDNATKRDHGDLFDVMSNKLGVDKAGILHLGDNYQGDVEKAIEKGLQAYHYLPKRVPEAPLHYSPAASLARGSIQLHYPVVAEKSCFELGFQYGGPACLSYLQWIENKAKEDKIDKVLFLARDGFLLKQIVDEYKSVDFPKYDYFYGSRTTFNLAAINEDNFNEAIPYFLSGSEGLSPFEILERIGVAAPDAGVMESLGLDDGLILNASNDIDMQRFLHAFRWEILKVCKRNRRALFKYLNELNIKSGDNIALIDVGWSGSSQESFIKVVKQLIDVNVFGYYFCLAETSEKKERENSQNMAGLISAESVDIKTLNDIYKNRVTIETFFSAPHDTVIGLQIHNSKVFPVTDTGRGEKYESINKVKEINEGGFYFSQKYQQLLTRLAFPSSTEELHWLLIDFVTSGKWGDISHFSEMNNFDTWASTKNKNISLVDYL
ncbi:MULTISPECIES: hypothetical protein [unclassified Pseudoalteromonas]|uniref:HAD family hydrolase n=1 Tax=unclassified Pseudoalteromonas TaxID=194690 RepID=UPI0006943293|nr:MULTISPECIES: hypothetical protein [unclassified Pseudoalteromonas]